MAINQYDYPAIAACVDAAGHGAGTHTAKNTWTESLGADCASSVNEAVGALNERNYGFLRSRATAGVYAPGTFVWTFGAPPSGVTISKLILYGYCRTSTANAAVVDEPPRMRGFVQQNSGAAKNYQAGPAYTAVTKACSRASSGPTGTFGLFKFGEWLVCPWTGAAWTQADLVAGTFRAGLESGGIAQGQLGDGIPPTTGGSSASFDCAQFYVVLETTSSELVVEPVRQILSRLLRLARRPTRPVSLSLPVHFADADPSDPETNVIFAEGRWWPSEGGAGVSSKAWDVRPIRVLDVTEAPGAQTVQISGLDIREAACSYWSPLYTDLGADDNFNGIPELHMGGGHAVARAQGAWIWRPGDFLLRDAVADKWRLTPWGLLIGGGGGAGQGALTYRPLNNTFSQGAGNVFTNWTITANTGAATQETGIYIFDIAGYRRALKLTNDAYARADTTAAITTGTKIRLFMKWKSTTGAPKWQIRDTTANRRWQHGAGWVVTAGVFNDVAGGTTRLVGDHYEWWSDEITCDACATPTIDVAVGSSASAGPHYIFAFGFVVPDATAGQAGRVIRRDFLATQAALLTQVADVVTLDNQSGYRVWPAERGTITAAILPLWDLADLQDNAVKYVATGMMDDAYAGGAAAFRLYLQRTGAGNARLVFDVIRGGATLGTAYKDLGALTYFNAPVYATARWTSSSGELGLPARALDVFVAGVKGTSGAAAAALAATETSKVQLGSYPGGAAYEYLDGMLAHLELRPFCLTDAEIIRAHSQLSLPDRPTAV